MIDVHSHTIEGQTGGLLLAIEGAPNVPGGKTFVELSRTEERDGFIKVPYVHAANEHSDSKIIYIHPRRNGYSVADVQRILVESRAAVVVLDTFSGFLWSPKEYYELINQFPQKTFLLAHGGGYQIRDFVQLARFTQNTFIDFSATQEIFGCVDGNDRLDCGVTDLIVHSLNEPRLRRKVLFGSDNPEFSQQKAMAFYRQLDSSCDQLFQENFERMISVL